ncbi:carbohydrate ABC transporter permease [Paenibacillus senegalensis]|uniref:carbohydrate ABC transporter permease n=1 Tax=Paenibacillus senegalensis TaxID=1465766 RepID=UPI000289E9FC|nr:carbohydrate ABC transporter permease [Paenibacillus senegalensis]
MKQYRTPSRTVFQIFNYSFFILFSITILVPFINAVAISFSSSAAARSGSIGLWPVDFQLDAYLMLMNSATFIRSFANTVFLTAINTILVIIVSLSTAYALSSKNMVMRRTVFYYIIFTMFFSGGLIPTYLLVNNLGITNSYWALILPGIVNGFYVIVFKNVIDQLPGELLESAEIDGAGDFRMLFQMVLPLVLPMTMAFTIFSAVAYWNEWFGVLLYIRDSQYWTLQFQLRDILVTSTVSQDFNTDLREQFGLAVHPENLKMAALMITVLPIIAIYPFVQKYFIHGQLVGAVKG